MTDQERDALLLELRDRLERIEATQGQHTKTLNQQGEHLDVIENRILDLRRDLRDHHVLPPEEEAV